MDRPIQRLSLLLFAFYLGLIPNSSLLVALDAVPAWGRGFGGALLLLQGAAMFAWLGWRYRWRGLAAGCVVATLGFMIEYIGATSGFPFGRYFYTELVQPQVFNTVPLAICAAWMMTATSAYEIANQLVLKRFGRNAVLLLTATLVLVLDLQIETVAALINRYWVWVDSGPYYAVPTANFVAWWLVGFAMAWVLAYLLPARAVAPHAIIANVAMVKPFHNQIMQQMPALLYLCSTAMFTVINLARGYVLAGAIGLVVLLIAGILTSRFGGVAWRPIVRRRFD